MYSKLSAVGLVFWRAPRVWKLWNAPGAFSDVLEWDMAAPANIRDAAPGNVPQRFHPP